MIRLRNKNSTIIFLAFLAVLAAIFWFFISRVRSGELVTPHTPGQVCKFAEGVIAGKIFDRSGNLVAEGLENGDPAYINGEAKANFNAVLGTVEEMADRTKIISNAPELYVGSDRLTLDGFLHPDAERIGGNIKLTLDSELQSYIRERIAGYENAYVMVSNYRTGEILGMYGDVFTDMIHPGSAVKPILTAAALSVDPELKDYVYNCSPDNHKFKTYDGKVIKINCYGGGAHGQMDLKTAMAKSCNGYFVSLLQQVDSKELMKALQNFGFDSTICHSQFMYWDHMFAKAGSDGTAYLQAAIGQSECFATAAGLNFCYSAILNGGVLKEPVWIAAKQKQSEDPWTEIVENDDIRMCSEDAAELVCSLMEGVTTVGTGKGFGGLEGFAAKTGTADRTDAYISLWTSGGLRSKETPYCVTVCLDKTQSGTSSSTAGKIVRDVLSYMIETTGGKSNE